MYAAVQSSMLIPTAQVKSTIKEYTMMQIWIQEYKVQPDARKQKR